MKKRTHLILLFILVLFSCTEENYYTTADGLGKVNVYIEGDITDAECAAKLKAEVGSITENIYIGSNTAGILIPNITSIELDLPLNVKLVEFRGNYDNLKTIKIKGHGAMPYSKITVLTGKKTENVLIEGITELNQIETRFSNLEILNSKIEIKDLKEVRLSFSFQGYNGSINSNIPNNINCTFICNSLKYVDRHGTYDPTLIGGGGSIGGYFTSFVMSELEEMIESTLYVSAYNSEITLPKLRKVRGLNCSVYSSYLNNPTIFNFPALTYSHDGVACLGNYLDILNLPVLTHCDGINLKDTQLPRINFNAPVINYCTYYKSNIGLNTNEVNTIINKFLTIQPQSDKLIDLLQEVAPNGQGIIDKQTLINQGNQVWSN